MSTARRNNVQVTGSGDRAIVFAHGFGCDQNMWRFVAPEFTEDFRVVTFDFVGAGGSMLSAYDKVRYATLEGYATDVIEICEELEISNAVFVGHSVAAMVGVLAANRDPSLFERIVLVGPSPCYISKDDYIGGFTEAQIHELLDFLDVNHMGWSQAMAPVIMGNPDRPELADELTNSFCRTDPEIAKRFARTTFLSDNRSDLPKLAIPALILQCRDDVIAPEAVGRYVQQHVQDGRMVLLDAVGHCPNLSAPAETSAAIKAFV